MLHCVIRRSVFSWSSNTLIRNGKIALSFLEIVALLAMVLFIYSFTTHWWPVVMAIYARSWKPYWDFYMEGSMLLERCIAANN